MFGVVLWSDKRKNRAVIWCEDHRNLAFFRQEDDAGQEDGFVPGDLVEFDLREENDLRLAVDPCLVAPHEYPSLARDLTLACTGACAGIAREVTSPPRPDPGEESVGVLHRRRPAPRAAMAARRSIA